MTAEPARRVVVVAASAGGIEALRGLLRGLPDGFAGALLIVLHVAAEGGSVLPKILGRAGPLIASAAADGQEVLAGHVYVAPPDRHMLLSDGKVRLSQGPRHNGHRPAADPLFLSAALAAGPRAVGVVLSGTLDDGAAGSAAIEARGGAVIVQDPSESAYDGMPLAAIAATQRPTVLRLRDMPAELDRLLGAPAPADAPAPDAALQRQLSVFLDPFPAPTAAPSAWSGVSCPECGGPLRQEDDSTPVRFQCQAGHAWSPESLVAAQAAGIERALWAAVLRLEERARLDEVMADTAAGRGYPVSASGFHSTAHSARSAARQIRGLLGSAGAAVAPADTGDSGGEGEHEDGQ